MDIVTLGAALNGSKAYTDQVTQSLMGGVHYRGSVSYYSDLPNDAAEGDSYTVKYAGTSGTVADGTEYTWGYDTDSQNFAWISFSKDTYSKAEIDNKLVGSNIALTGYAKGTTAKQDVSPTDNVNQGLGKIEKRVSDNETNISTVSDANGTKNLLDFNDWASKVNTTRTTKSISENSITLTATGKDAYTDGVAATCPASGKIACKPNTTYVITWETTSTSASDNVYIFPANASPYYTAATTKYIEYTMPAGCKYFTFRFGVANSGDTVTYSNIMICEKSLYDISNQYKPYALSNAKLTTKEKQNENNILFIQREQITQNREIATLREITKCKLYGFKIDKQDVNPDTRVTYLYDAVGMTPAYMDFSGGSFNYGSWADIWFIKNNRPVALKFDGTVDYELSHTDFTKKIDGETASDVEDVNYAGNFMSEIPLVYVKRWEDERYNYIVFSETKPNDDYLAQAHTNANGTINPYIYLPMFKGWEDSGNKLRSLMGTYPTGNTTGANEVTYASNCGTGWQLWDKSKIDLVMDLIVLITKSTNCRAKIGNGNCQTYNVSDTTNYGKMKSGYETDGTTRSANAQFYGSEGTEVTNYGKHHMIAFYIEDLWGNRWDRCLGFNLVDNVYKVKMAPPYVLDSDSTYQSLSVTPPSSTEGWLKNVSSGVYGDVPTEVGASSTSGFANYFYKNVSGNRLSLFGGSADDGLRVGRCWCLDADSGGSYWHVGGSPCYTAL